MPDLSRSSELLAQRFSVHRHYGCRLHFRSDILPSIYDEVPSPSALPRLKLGGKEENNAKRDLEVLRSEVQSIPRLDDRDAETLESPALLLKLAHARGSSTYLCLSSTQATATFNMSRITRSPVPTLAATLWTPDDCSTRSPAPTLLTAYEAVCSSDLHRRQSGSLSEDEPSISSLKA